MKFRINNKCLKFYIIPLMTALIIASISLIPPASATETKISVMPAKNIFHTGTTPVNDTFSVNVSVVDGVNVWNWQVNFTFDPTLLECVSAIIPSDSPFAFPVAPDPVIDNVNGYVLIGASKLGATPGVNGSGTLTTITLKIIEAPTTTLSCTLNLTEGTRLKDNTMNLIPATLEPGYYEYSYSEVLVHEITYEGETFTIITESNATITPVPMILEPDEKRLAFNISGTNGASGFIQVIIPYDFMHGEWSVTVNGESVAPEISSNSTHTTLYFTAGLTGENQLVYISATWLVPEFTLNVLLFALAATSLIVVIARKSKPYKIHNHHP